MAGEKRYYQDDEVWWQLNQIAEVTGQGPDEVALDILRQGIQARMETERFRLEAEMTALKARMATLNHAEVSSKVAQRPVQPSNGQRASVPPMTPKEAARAVLDSDRNRTWNTREVMGQMSTMGFNLAADHFFQTVNGALHALVREGKARQPARGQFTWRRLSPRGQS